MPSYPYNVPTQSSSSGVSALSIGAGVAGAALGAFGAIQQNKRVSAALRENYNSITKDQTNAQRQGFEQTYIQSREANYNQGAFINTIAGQSGDAYRAIVSQMFADSAYSAANIKENTQSVVDSLQNQKKSLFTSAKSQMTSPIGAALTTGANFLGTAMQVETALANSKITDSAANEAAAAKQIFDSGDPAAIYALTQKQLPASVIQSGRLNNVIRDDYNNYVVLQQIQREMVKNIYNTNRGIYK